MAQHITAGAQSIMTPVSLTLDINLHEPVYQDKAAVLVPNKKPSASMESVSLPPSVTLANVIATSHGSLLKTSSALSCRSRCARESE
eukprot:4080157-Amphidinium_carterae.1